MIFLCTVSALKGKWTVIVLLLCLFGQVRKEVVGRQEVARLLRQCCGSRSDRWRQWSWHLSGLFFATLACFQKVEDFLRLSKPFFDTQLAEIVPKFGHFWWLYYVLALEWWHLRWTSRGLYVFLSPSCSLSKTTKLILLDSLLQEVCISSGSDWSLALSSLGLSVCLSQSQTSFCRAKESPLNHWIYNWTSKSCVVRLSEPDLWRETLLSLVVGIFDWSSRKWLGEGVVLGERIGWLTASSLLDCILSIW